MNKKIRNGVAISARKRKSKPMKHRTAPKGGSKNKKEDILKDQEK